jgi:hypothetical protein
LMRDSWVWFEVHRHSIIHSSKIQVPILSFSHVTFLSFIFGWGWDHQSFGILTTLCLDKSGPRNLLQPTYLNSRTHLVSEPLPFKNSL